MKKLIALYLRGIKRSKLSFVINLIGLAGGLACTFLIYLWIRDEKNIDKFHVNNDRLYQVRLWVKHGDGSESTSSILPGVLGEVLSAVIPEIDKSVPILDATRVSTLTNGNSTFKTKGIYVGPDLFNIFSFNLLDRGKKDILSDPSNIVISKEMALKLFGTTQNVVGKFVEFNKTERFTVAAISDVDPSSSIKFDFVLSVKVFQRHTGIEVSMNESIANLYFLLKDHNDPKVVDRKMQGWLKGQGEDTTKARLFTTHFSDGYLHGNFENGIQSGGRIDYVNLFLIIGIVILLIACINFVSLSTATATNRMKEVGMKKILGASKASILLQNLSESVVLSFLSLFLALVAVALFLPSFNILADKHMEISGSLSIFPVFIIITLFTGLFAGLYPAWYVAKFEPAMLLKGKSSDSSGGVWIRKGLVITQFAVSVVLIVITFVVYNQFSMIQSRNLGYNRSNVLYFDADGQLASRKDAFFAELKNEPGVLQASSIYTLSTTSSFFGSAGGTSHLDWPGKTPKESVNMNYRIVDYDLIELLGMKMDQGRSFSRDFAADSSHQVIFNEAAVKAMGLKQPVGTIVKIWGDPYKIIGVIKDFYFQSIHEGNVKPLFMRQDPGKLNTIMVKVAGKNLDQTIYKLKNIYNQFNPGYPFVYRFLDDDFQTMYSAEHRISVLSKYFSGLAIIISCLGLFGLTTFTVSKRKKEISTRKVLGASSYQILILLYKDISRLVIISILIGLPIGYILSHNWLQSFAVRINLEPWFFIVAGGGAFLLMLISSCIQILRALYINPADSLRTE